MQFHGSPSGCTSATGRCGNGSIEESSTRRPTDSIADDELLAFGSTTGESAHSRASWRNVAPMEGSAQPRSCGISSRPQPSSGRPKIKQHGWSSAAILCNSEGGGDRRLHLIFAAAERARAGQQAVHSHAHRVNVGADAERVRGDSLWCLKEQGSIRRCGAILRSSLRQHRNRRAGNGLPNRGRDCWA